MSNYLTPSTASMRSSRSSLSPESSSLSPGLTHGSSASSIGSSVVSLSESDHRRPQLRHMPCYNSLSSASSLSRSNSESEPSGWDKVRAAALWARTTPRPTKIDLPLVDIEWPVIERVATPLEPPSSRLELRSTLPTLEEDGDDIEPLPRSTPPPSLPRSKTIPLPETGFDIFSPRLSQPGTLRPVEDLEPPSPLELPSLVHTFSSLYKRESRPHWTRHSAQYRPRIMHAPTPPSLITSPKILGGVPPLLSPTSPTSVTYRRRSIRGGVLPSFASTATRGNPYFY